MKKRFHCIATPPDYPSWRAQGCGPTAQIAFSQALAAAEEYIAQYNALSGPIEKWNFKTMDRELEIEVILYTNHYLARRFSGRF